MPPKFSLEDWPIPEGTDNPFNTVFITKPSTLFNVSVGEKMNRIDWKVKHVGKNLENSWKRGRHFLYCEGTSSIIYKMVNL